MKNNSDICDSVSSIVLDCFLVHHKNMNFGAYTQIMDTIKSRTENTMTLELEIVNKETPEMKQLISGIKEMTKRLKESSETHRPLFGGETYLTGREVCERLFISPAPCWTIGTRASFPTLKSQGKYSTVSPILINYSKKLSEIKHSQGAFFYRWATTQKEPAEWSPKRY